MRELECDNETKARHPECHSTVQDKKTLCSKKTEKTYKVIVTYINISEEEAKVKRAIIESIIKKCIQKKL
ncbi:hypothetical protein [Pedobacter panaciterrae]|uniref:hypothetical protein n=1 Tax=Pedobacter panaciterrae TaxID=363849 RepID=UPI002595AD9B|nr:hypothetical protein [uncultured Pedobacter sp.]